MDIKKNVDLFPHTTLRMRAVAEHFFIARTREDLIGGVEYARNNNIPIHVFGGGSNLAIVTKKVKGLVVKNIYIEKKIVSETTEHVDLMVSSGYPVTKIVNETADAGYEGLEYQLGLPGSIGGGIYMNSKWTNPECYFGDALHKASLLDPKGKIKTVDRDYFKFRYDYSILHDTQEILLEAVFRLKKNDPELLRKRAQESLAYRKKTQPTGVATSGCFFQNITEEERERAGVHTKSAGNLIDKAGLKDLQIGNFIVSPMHGNFIVNKGEGNPDDLAKMMRHIKAKVKDKFGIDLKEEVVVI